MSVSRALCLLTLCALSVTIHKIQCPSLEEHYSDVLEELLVEELKRELKERGWCILLEGCAKYSTLGCNTSITVRYSTLLFYRV